MTPGRTISIPRLKAFCSDAFERAGLSPQDADTGAEVLSTTDAWGVFTHGSKVLRGYLRRLAAGGLQARGRPRLTSEGQAWGLVDGDSSLGMVTSVFAMKLAISKARDSGLAYVGVRNSCHFGAAGYYAALAAGEGLIGLSMANDIPSVAAPGSRSAVTGSNPLAYAVPAGRHRPLMLDMSIATVAGGKVYAARERGERIPATWLIGPDGLPTDDPASFPEHSVLAPAAAHKGFGLALLIESLAGCLSGAATTWQIGRLDGRRSLPPHLPRRRLPGHRRRHDQPRPAAPGGATRRRSARRPPGGGRGPPLRPWGNRVGTVRGLDG